MDIEIFKKKLENITSLWNTNIKPLEDKAREFIGLKIKIPKGEYKGRWGEITHVTINNLDGTVYAVLAPYRIKKGRGDSELLDTRNDARVFWPLRDIKEVKLRKE